MKKIPALFILMLIISAPTHAQLSLTKMVGKNADKYKLGYCLFAYYDFPLTEEGNKSIRLELMDLAIILVRSVTMPVLIFRSNWVIKTYSVKQRPECMLNPR